MGSCYFDPAVQKRSGFDVALVFPRFETSHGVFCIPVLTLPPLSLSHQVGREVPLDRGRGIQLDHEMTR